MSRASRMRAALVFIARFRTRSLAHPRRGPTADAAGVDPCRWRDGAIRRPPERHNLVSTSGGRLCGARPEPPDEVMWMRRSFPELPGWSFLIEEVSAGVYEVTAKDAAGHRV